MALLRLDKPSDAIAEFKKVTGRPDRGAFDGGPVYPASQLGLARAATLAGDREAAQRANKAFFDLWNEADSDIPQTLTPE
jgi:hypothetical protein